MTHVINSDTIIDRTGTISNLSADEILALEPSERPSLELAGKLSLVCWIFYVCFVWCAKVCLLIYYNSFMYALRLPPELKNLLISLHRNHLWQQKQKRLIKIAAYLLGASFIAVIVTILTHCTPIKDNWRADQVPSCSLKSTAFKYCKKADSF